MIIARTIQVIGTALVALAISGAARGAEAPVVGHPDNRGFPIPALADPPVGFGTNLEKACKAFKPPPPSPPAAADGGAAAPSPSASAAGNAVPPPAPPAAKRLEADAPEAPIAAVTQMAEDDSSMEAVVGGLRYVCDKIDKRNLEDPELKLLRELLRSGLFPAISQGLAERKFKGAELRSTLGQSSGNSQSSGNDFTASLSGFESNVLNGLADFLVTRSKEEAILYLKDQIADKFCKDGTDALLVIPRTCAAITSLDENLSIAVMGSALNAAAKRDLALLPDGLLKVLSKRDTQAFGVYESLRLLYAIVLDVRGGRAPLDVARSLHALPLRDCERQEQPEAADKACQTAFLTFRGASALLYAGQANVVTQYQARLVEHSALVVGTLVETESYANAELKVQPPNAPRLTFNKDQVNEALRGLGYIKLVLDAQAMLTSLQNDKNALTKLDAKGTPTDRIRLLVNSLSDALVRTGQLATALAPLVVPDEEARKAMLISATVIRDAADIARSTVSEDYAAIPLDVSTLLTDLGSCHGKTLAEAQKLLPVVTEIASAKSSADVSTALQAAAAPADSYRAKYQRAKFTIDALVGAMAGLEAPNDPQDTTTFGHAKNSPMVAGFAPVGIEGTVPFGSWFYGGLMLSVIDVGALTTARFKEEATNANPTTVKTETSVTFTQVFSPGAYVVFGIGKSPFVIGGGVSYAPSLRTVEFQDASGNTLDEKLSALRYGGFAAIDVSLFSL